MLNVDSAVSGPDLDIDGVPSLRDLVLDAAGAITDVRTGRTLRDVWLEARAHGLGRPAPARPRRPALGRRPRLGRVERVRSPRRSPRR